MTEQYVPLAVLRLTYEIQPWMWFVDWADGCEVWICQLTHQCTCKALKRESGRDGGRAIKGRCGQRDGVRVGGKGGWQDRLGYD